MLGVFFYLFAAVTLLGGVGVVASRNPVTSAFSMIASFVGLASLFIMLNAYLAGILQILVYAGAIMVLFLFIIMLMDLKTEENRSIPWKGVFGGSLLVGLFCMQLTAVLREFDFGYERLGDQALNGEAANDVEHIGKLLFTDYLFPLQVIGVLLLVATIGVVVLSKRELR